MEEVKRCPYCDEEILAVAKKCKHCGEWLTETCPYCAEEILAGTTKCEHCGELLNDDDPNNTANDAATEDFTSAPPPQPPREYRYFDGNEQSEPLTVDQLKSVDLEPDTLVWTEGFDEWKPAKEVEELSILFGIPSPPMSSTSASSITNKNKKSKVGWIIGGIAVALVLIVPIAIYLVAPNVLFLGDLNLFQKQQHNIQVFEPEMVFVHGGTFTMGCTAEQGADCFNEEKPAHRVTVGSFNIGKYEVTQAQWEAVMDYNPSEFKGDNLPVENISWDDAQMFIGKLNELTGKNYRLPTEAEWEYAARGGNKSMGYKYSGSNTLANVAWYKDNADSRTYPAGTKQPNELGIYDMSGNVREWCSDWSGRYSDNAQTNPQGASSGTYRVVRGGSWGSGAAYCRVAYRNRTPDEIGNFLGFRVVLPSDSQVSVTTDDDDMLHGTSGNISWSISGGTLTIGGRGAIPDYSLTGKGYGYFSDAPWLSHVVTDVIIENGITRIGDNAFYSCGLKSVTIPNSVTSIGESAFSESNLESVTIPGSVTSIETDAFSCYFYSSHLTVINVDKSNTVYASENGILYNKAKTILLQYPQAKTDTSYTIPNSVTSIANDAFRGRKLTSVIILNSVTSIKDGTFAGCNKLTSVTIPNSATFIGESAFEDCPLTEVINYATKPQSIDRSVFVFYTYDEPEGDYCCDAHDVTPAQMKLRTLRVPAESVAAYRIAPVWKEFGKIEAIE